MPEKYTESEEFKQDFKALIKAIGKLTTEFSNLNARNTFRDLDRK